MKIILIILLSLSISSQAVADEWSFKPSITFGVGTSPSFGQENIYGLVQVYSINYGGEEGGLRFLGIGSSIGVDSKFVLTPVMTCIMDKLCVGPHFGADLVGLGVSYSFGGP